MRIPSAMMTGHNFSQVPSAEIPRSKFSRSHGVKTTFNAGFLIPFLVDDVLPGDTYVVNLTALARMSTPIKPLMDNLYLDTFYFFVPYRLVWDNWQRFMGEQANPTDSTDFTVPQCEPPVGGYGSGTIFDYMGLPVQVPNTNSSSWSHSALPLRAYNLIWNEWFRDQNLQPSVPVPKVDGPDVAQLNYDIWRRGKRHDYFTSCLPWPQKGNEAMIPVGGTAPVIPTGAQVQPLWKTAAGGESVPGGLRVGTTISSGVSNVKVAFPSTQADNESLYWHTTNLVANLSQATSVTINSLRQAFQIQKLMERDARGGTRYTEILRSHFGVISPDARLQRPEYLGGGSTPIQISPIAQTSGSAPTDGYTETPQGNLSAMGTAAVHGHGFAKSFTEHGVVIGLMSVRADLTYQQGLERFWSRETKYDFYWPALCSIGEQAVLNKEIFCQDDSAANEAVFGYQERYAEYRYKPSRITGKFRSTVTDTLEIWHLSQEFTTLPTLSPSFIEENPPIDRVVAVPTEPQFLFDGYVSMTCARPMPVFGVPGMIDHF